MAVYPRKGSLQKASPAKGIADLPKFKAIWEPALFNKDIDLNAIACVGPEICRVVAGQSTIFLTTDGEASIPAATPNRNGPRWAKYNG
jgi:hypothetical protein